MKRQLLWAVALAAAMSRDFADGSGPIDDQHRPLIRKLGTIDLDMVETTPIVLGGKLWRFEWVRQGISQQYRRNYSWGNQQGIEFLAEAVYEGTIQQFLHGWFPGQL